MRRLERYQRKAVRQYRREAMRRWRRTKRTRVAQAAGVVQAGVVRTGCHGAGGRAADGVRGMSCGFRRYSWLMLEPGLHSQTCKSEPCIVHVGPTFFPYEVKDW